MITRPKISVKIKNVPEFDFTYAKEQAEKLVTEQRTRPKIKITLKPITKQTTLESSMKTLFKPTTKTFAPNTFALTHEPLRVSPIIPCYAPNKLPPDDLWTEKYRPQKLEGLVGNTEQIKTICEWFERYKKRDPTISRALLFSGCPGTSKTSVAHVVLKEFGYDVKEYNASDVRNKTLVKDNLDKLTSMEQVDKDLRDDAKPIGIIMDEVDGMSSGDKGGIAQLIRTINPARKQKNMTKEEKRQLSNHWIPPIICICNNNLDKKIKELKKDCLEVKFYRPSIKQLSTVIDNVCAQEKITIDNNAKQYIATKAQGDFRRLMSLLQNFVVTCKSNNTSIIDISSIYESLETVCEKNVDLNPYEMTSKIFGDKTQVSDIIRLYETDKSLLPMMIHENYISVIGTQYRSTPRELLELCVKSIKSIVLGDIIEKMMYNAQSWYLQTVHGLASCYIPSYYANIHNKIDPSMKWTTTLGKFSYQRSNIKNINEIMSTLNTGKQYTVSDIQILSQLILHNLLSDNIELNKIGIEYMKNYNLSIDDIDQLVKVDKLSDKYKKLYTSRKRTALSKLIPPTLKTKQNTESLLYYGKKSSKSRKTDDDSESDTSDNEPDFE